MIDPMREGPKKELEFRDYLRVMQRRKAIIVPAVLIVTVAAVVYSLLQTPVYAASAELLLQPRSSGSLFDPTSGLRIDPARAMQTEIQVMRGQQVAEVVRQRVGSAPGVLPSPVNGTDVMEVRAESTVPKQAAAVANAYVSAYIDYKRQQAIDEVLAGTDQIQARITDLQKQIDAITSPQAAGQKDALVAAQSQFKQKLDQLQVDKALETGGAQLVTAASVPTAPVRPNPLRSGVVALAVGLVLGIAIAFLVDYLDDSVKTKDDLEDATEGLPVLGIIPVVSDWRPQGEPMLVSITTPKSPAAEAYRTLRTSIQFLGLDRPMRSLQITSPGPQEGKSTTMANLGVALARAGQTVVIVCCDLRRPRIHEFFGLDNEAGFTSVLLGKLPLTAAIQAVPVQPRLSLLASGPLPPNPSELLSSRRTTEVLRLMQEEFDIVLIDCPPVLPVTDALVLSGQVDATLLVGVSGATTRKEVARAVELLRQVDAPLIGSVLNGVTAEGSYGYDYQYDRYEPAETQRRAGGRKNGPRPDDAVSSAVEK
jgi:capsular exopolysaccharide synthesis family protein